MFPVTTVKWRKAYRIVPSRYPPIDLFERVAADPAQWEMLAEIEMITNPRVRDEIGEISLVPADERISGPGAAWVMAPFTHLNPRGSRFSDGSYGVYYAADRLATTVQETIYHMGLIYADSRDQSHDEDMRVLVGPINGGFRDLTKDREAAATYLDANSYGQSQELGQQVRDAGGDGIFYPSVRNFGHPCVAAFRPKVVGIPVQDRHLNYHWNGREISRVFDYSADRWIADDDFR